MHPSLDRVPAGPIALGRERLERALAEDELTLFCQPIRELSTNRYAIAEALVRMRDEEKALIPPGEFLPVFEEFGMLPQLDRWVVRQVVGTLRRGSRVPAFSVNLSAPTLADASFPEFVAAELRTAGVAAQALLFELDESDFSHSLDSASSAAAALQLAGCRVIVDSFGATSQSLEYLKHLRVDMLKLDASIVRKVLSASAARRLIETVLRIAGTLDIGVIAGWVEEQDVLLRLKALGVGYVQGFGIHEPGPVDKIAG